MLVTASCGRDAGDIDDVIGASCASNSDCATRCYRDSARYPDGFCSQPCTTDNDCPGGTSCIESDGGVCLLLCPEFDCSRLGPGYECNGKQHAGGGSVEVCTGA